MEWTVKWLPEARDDLANMDNSIRKKVLKAVLKLATDPIGYGEPLGNKRGIDLKNLYKIEPADGYRVVYTVFKQQVIVAIVAVEKRAKSQVYKIAAQMIAEYRKLTNDELARLAKLV